MIITTLIIPFFANHLLITNRDLKAKEPFFSSGFNFGEEESMGAIKQKLKGAIDSQRDFLKNLDTDAQSIKMAHKYVTNNVHNPTKFSRCEERGNTGNLEYVNWMTKRIN